uniref:ATP synthase F0 subunit 8 n=1 Tax=Geothelphusa dehaani TaxID=290333 RepID=Q4AEB5_GEODE|nr:ATP synthase F0 subunit 8 [Geothelphusa dehaani]BAE19770.1 ATP synthase F0 subunit 8 [Geothelphusa dehaani]
MPQMSPMFWLFLFFFFLLSFFLFFMLNYFIKPFKLFSTPLISLKLSKLSWKL